MGFVDRDNFHVAHVTITLCKPLKHEYLNVVEQLSSGPKGSALWKAWRASSGWQKTIGAIAAEASPSANATKLGYKLAMRPMLHKC